MNGQERQKGQDRRERMQETEEGQKKDVYGYTTFDYIKIQGLHDTYGEMLQAFEAKRPGWHLWRHKQERTEGNLRLYDWACLNNKLLAEKIKKEIIFSADEDYFNNYRLFKKENESSGYMWLQNDLWVSKTPSSIQENTAVKGAGARRGTAALMIGLYAISAFGALVTKIALSTGLSAHTAVLLTAAGCTGGMAGIIGTAGTALVVALAVTAMAVAAYGAYRLYKHYNKKPEPHEPPAPPGQSTVFATQHSTSFRKDNNKSRIFQSGNYFRFGST